MSKRIVLLFDGTWNNKSDRTNVIRMVETIDSSGHDDPEQPRYYDTGVGTNWYDKLTGGAFGHGLSENICQGYAWLAKKYVPGDDIYLFGFSRGAYTARSLVGLIRKCGLLKQANSHLTEKAYALYRRKDASPDTTAARDFRQRHSHEVRVKFIGVWDTVGALGIPLSHVPFSRDYYRFHDTELSKIVDYAYHAIATNEHRQDYAPTLWTKIKPENKDVEQRWFIGAHSNVGGGYNNDVLPDLPLRWLQDKSVAAGLKITHPLELQPTCHLGEINDSFSEFMFGFYKFFRKPYQRIYGNGVNETVDPSVWLRWQTDPKFRPTCLANCEIPAGITEPIPS